MVKRKRSVKSPDIKFDEFCTFFRMTDKDSFKICVTMLENLYKQATSADKKPLLVLGIRRNDTEVFTLTGELTIEKQRRTK